MKPISASWSTRLPGALLLKLNWIDNPWFGGELERERLLLKQRDPDAYLNVYEGQPRDTHLDGAIYAKELTSKPLSQVGLQGFRMTLPSPFTLSGI
jgi:hypothetical protein